MSDTNIVKLVPATRPCEAVDEGVVALLETLLSEAKAGGFNGLMVATVAATSAGAIVSMGSAYAGEGVEQNAHASIGAASALHHRMLSRLEWADDE